MNSERNRRKSGQGREKREKEPLDIGKGEKTERWDRMRDLPTAMPA